MTANAWTAWRSRRCLGAGDRHGTAYHVSVDLAAGTGTGVSAFDRAATVRRLADERARPEDFLRPGHVFPLAGRPGGLAERRGHTEASLALCRAAGLPTVAVICEVMAPDGHMLAGSAVERFALRWGDPDDLDRRAGRPPLTGRGSQGQRKPESLFAYTWWDGPPPRSATAAAPSAAAAACRSRGSERCGAGVRRYPD